MPANLLQIIVQAGALGVLVLVLWMQSRREDRRETRLEKRDERFGQVLAAVEKTLVGLDARVARGLEYGEAVEAKVNGVAKEVHELHSVLVEGTKPRASSR